MPLIHVSADNLDLLLIIIAIVVVIIIIIIVGLPSDQRIRMSLSERLRTK